MTDTLGTNISPPATRKQSPSYDVFELRALREPASYDEDPASHSPVVEGSEIAAWVLLAENVKASNWREAITATALRSGTFAAELHPALRPRVREQQTVTKEVWT